MPHPTLCRVPYHPVPGPMPSHTAMPLSCAVLLGSASLGQVLCHPTELHQVLYHNAGSCSAPSTAALDPAPSHWVLHQVLDHSAASHAAAVLCHLAGSHITPLQVPCCPVLSCWVPLCSGYHCSRSNTQGLHRCISANGDTWTGTLETSGTLQRIPGAQRIRSLKLWECLPGAAGLCRQLFVACVFQL